LPEPCIDDLDVDIGFEQRKTHVPERLVDIFLGDLAVTP
jgi:hypothetical protein